MNTLYQTFKEEERQVFKSWLQSHLSFGPVTVTFIKRDGTEREMLCTTKTELVEAYEKKTDRKINEDICFIYDLDNKAWRSFRYDSVTRVQFTV